MEMALGFAIFVGVVGLIAAIAVVAQQLEKKRTLKVEQVASGMGLTFAPQGDADLQSRLSGMGLFGLGRDRRLTNLISGETDECRISIFDYRYTTGSGKQTHTTKITVAALESVRLRAPVFSLRPENLFDKIGGLFGFQDIDFPDHPLFSQKFVLKGPEEEAIRQFFSRNLLDFFASKNSLCVEAIPGTMVYYVPGQRRKPEDFPALLEDAYKVFGVIVDT